MDLKNIIGVIKVLIEYENKVLELKPEESWK
jgi:hypothetical protein